MAFTLSINQSSKSSNFENTQVEFMALLQALCCFDVIIDRLSLSDSPFGHKHIKTVGLQFSAISAVNIDRLSLSESPFGHKHIKTIRLQLDLDVICDGKLFSIKPLQVMQPVSLLLHTTLIIKIIGQFSLIYGHLYTIKGGLAIINILMSFQFMITKRFSWFSLDIEKCQKMLTFSSIVTTIPTFCFATLISNIILQCLFLVTTCRRK